MNAIGHEAMMHPNSSRTGGFNGGATDCEAEDGEEDLANGDPFAEGEKLQ